MSQDILICHGYFQEIVRNNVIPESRLCSGRMWLVHRRATNGRSALNCRIGTRIGAISRSRTFGIPSHTSPPKPSLSFVHISGSPLHAIFSRSGKRCLFCHGRSTLNARRDAPHVMSALCSGYRLKRAIRRR